MRWCELVWVNLNYDCSILETTSLTTWLLLIVPTAVMNMYCAYFNLLMSNLKANRSSHRDIVYNNAHITHLDTAVCSFIVYKFYNNKDWHSRALVLFAKSIETTDTRKQNVLCHVTLGYLKNIFIFIVFTYFCFSPHSSR